MTAFPSLQIASDTAESIPVQLTRQLRDLILSGVLRASDKLPSTRQLAGDLNISRGSVVSAYEQLVAEGYCASRQGAGTVVHPDLPPMPARQVGAGTQPSQPTHHHILPLTPGVTLSELSHRRSWIQAWRQAAHAAPVGVHGDPGLRHALAEYLRLSRATVVDPDRLFISGGAREGLLLVLAALEDRPRLGVESPGYASLHHLAARFGAELTGLEVDQQGLVTSRLPDNLDAVIVTPSHQYPSGASLPLQRRLELVEWARATGSWVIEDDYDAALRYTGEPLPLLSSLDSERVVTLGSFSSTAPQALGGGFVVAGSGLTEELRRARQDIGPALGSGIQTVWRILLDSGEYSRDLAHQRNRAMRRREILGAELPVTATMDERHGGSNAMVYLDDGLPLTSLELTEQFRRAHLGAVVDPEYWSISDHRGKPLYADVSSNMVLVGLGGGRDENFHQTCHAFGQILRG
ncbi:PLP-dependent aminotransferase family protein [Auritidibacter ignavus]|uniref:MocR-like pyridoxine biosynthesis transcription factor PdxR n=1 Tax=Auritidibacter ignavus TaxID=678932 RepID=UPI002FE52307